MSRPDDDKRKAESAAAVYLEMRGFKVVERGWRLPKAKVDILALKDNVMHFVEVKYSKTDGQRAALDVMSASELKRRQRAVFLWLEETKWQGDYELNTIDIAGPDYIVMSFV